MTDNPMPEPHGAQDLPDDRFSVLAAHALRLVASRPPRLETDPSANPELLAALCTAALSHDRDLLRETLDRMYRSGLSSEAVADIYIAAAARHLGAMWAEDRMSCTAVTIATARLQQTLRELGPDWKADHSGDPMAPSVLVLVSRSADHTLGAALLAGQLRREGLSVRLILGASTHDVTSAMGQIRFDAVMISAAMGERLETLRELVDCVRAASDAAPPVVVGGSIVESPHHTIDSLTAATTADLVTSDSGEAISFCGLTSMARFGAYAGQRN